VRRGLPILVLLSTLQVLAYADRLVLAAVLPRVEDALHLKHALGGLLGTMFLVGYFLASPIVGVLADRGRGRAVLVACAALWSAGTMACGLAHRLVTLAAGRVLVGAAEVGLAAIAPEILHRVAPSDRRTSWLGYFFVAAHVGAAFGLVLGGLVERGAGWRVAFFVAGAPGLLLAAACATIDPSVTTRDARDASRPALFGEIAALARNPRYVRIVAGYCAYTFAIGGFGHWAPELVSQKYRTSLATADVGLGVVALGGGVLGTVIGGFAGDRVARDRVGEDDRARAEMRWCAFACALAAPLGLFAIASSNAWAFLALLFACQVSLFASSAPLNAAILHSAPPSIRASALALAIFCIHLFGDLWSPTAVGLLGDVTSLDRAMAILPFALGIGAAIWWAGSRPRA
jgi:MFS family permease